MSHQLRDDTLAFLKRRHKLLIDGQWVGGDAVIASINPSTGEKIALITRGTPADVEAAVLTAQTSFEARRWRDKTDDERSDILYAVAKLIEQNAEQLAELETLDNGKPYGAALYGEVAMSARSFRYYAGWVGKLGGDVFSPSVPGRYHGYTRLEPIGVIGAITPWNGPLVMAAWKLAPALAAGCSLVIKPSEETSLTTLRLGELLLEAGVPPGVVNIVTGFGHDVGRAISEHPMVKKLAFTGSTAIGKSLISAASAQMTHLSLELGGKSPVLVFADADFDRALAGAADAIFANSGQVCVAGSRLYVQDEIYDQFIERLNERAQNIVIGDGFDTATQMGPLISQKHRNRVLDYVRLGQEAGANLLLGGECVGERGWYMSPTIFTETKPGMRVHDEEVFGPVLSVARFGSESDALRLANSSSYGLAASVWTQDISRLHRCIEHIEAGIVWGNSHGLPDMAMPIGGMKESGWGRENARQGIEMYMQTKSVLIQLDEAFHNKFL